MADVLLSDSTHPHVDVGSDADVLRDMTAFEWEHVTGKGVNTQPHNFLVCTEVGDHNCIGL
jgi:hypothetical protein